MPTETSPWLATVASARNAGSSTKKQPPALTTDNADMIDGQELDVDGNDQVSGIDNDTSQINEVVSSGDGDVNVSEGVREVRRCRLPWPRDWVPAQWMPLRCVTFQLRVTKWIRLTFGVYSLLDKDSEEWVDCPTSLQQSSQLPPLPAVLNSYGLDICTAYEIESSEAENDNNEDSNLAGEFSCCDDEPFQHANVNSDNTRNSQIAHSSKPS